MFKSLLVFTLLYSSTFSEDNRPLHVKISENKDWFVYDDILKWQSDSTAQKVIFLDFQTEGMRDSLHMINEFTEISEDYYPFKVNVTTNQAIYDQTALVDKMRMQYSESAPISTAGRCCGGACFGEEDGQNICWTKYPNNTGTGSHEIGHAFNLNHDWTYESPGYERGSPNFRPIMGSSSDALGSGSNMKFRTFWNLTPRPWEVEDQFKIIEGHLPRRADFVDDNFINANAITIDNQNILAEKNWSFITYPKWEHPDFGDSKEAVITDLDYWELSTEGGHLTLEITPTVLHNNLHLLASLYNQEGTLITEGTPLDNGHVVKQASRFSLNLAQGTYYIKVEPTGEPDNSHGKGYPVYGSVGFYQFAGSMDGITSSLAAKTQESIFDIHDGSKIEVVTYNGRVVHTFNNDDIDQTLRSLNLRSGVYFLISGKTSQRFQVNQSKIIYSK